MAIPEILYPIYMTGIYKRWCMCRILLKSATVDSTLVTLLHAYFKKYKKTALFEKLRWQDMAYMNTLSQELEWLMIRDGAEIAQNELIRFLFRLNFNHPCFFSYNVGKFKEKVRKVDTYLQEQREWLDSQQELAAMLVRQDIGYDLRLKDIKTQLHEYIQDQIRYVKKKEKLHRSNLFVKLGRTVGCVPLARTQSHSHL